MAVYLQSPIIRVAEHYPQWYLGCTFYTFPDKNNVKIIMLMMMTADVPIILNMIIIFSAAV